MGNTPVQYEAARAALAKCVKTDECKGWVDRAAAMKVYARQAKDREMEMNAVEIRVRAERRLGELIQLQKQTVGLAKGRAGPGRGKAGAKAGPAFNDAPTLADAGIDKKLSSRCQGLASIPECEFE